MRPELRPEATSALPRAPFEAASAAQPDRDRRRCKTRPPDQPCRPAGRRGADAQLLRWNRAQLDHHSQPVPNDLGRRGEDRNDGQLAVAGSGWPPCCRASLHRLGPIAVLLTRLTPHGHAVPE